ncbi:hypothetical protein JCM18904_4664 [Vibrio sp. JCM 18904]|nr:hypothetical protein JCM18904_4664 [Vibrio sp. JCM 18904]
MNPSSNPLVMLLDIFRSPTSCFLALYQRGGWGGWQPFIFLMLSPFLFWGVLTFRMSISRGSVTNLLRNFSKSTRSRLSY